MIKEHLVGAQITTGDECICNPEVLLGTKFGPWDFKNEIAPKGALLDLNAAWELFLSKKDFDFDVTFKEEYHPQHEVIDGVVYESGDTTYTLMDGDLPTQATFTIKANKGPVEHIEWQNGKLYLYYTKTRDITDEDLEDPDVPIHYVVDDQGNKVINNETGKYLIYDYVAIPVIEIFDNDETHTLFPWFADDQHTVRLRQTVDDPNDPASPHLGDLAITSDSELFVAKQRFANNQGNTLVSFQSLYEQLQSDLGVSPTFTNVNDLVDSEGLSIHQRANGSNIDSVLQTTDKSSLVNAINEDKTRVDKTHRLINAIDSLTIDEALAFSQYILSHKTDWTNNTRNLVDALNWIQESEIGHFLDDLNINITKLENNERVTVENITEALNSIFTEAEENRARIGYDSANRRWIALNTDHNSNLTDAINEVDEHTNALAYIVQVTENQDNQGNTYYTNPNLNNITKNRLRQGQANKDNVKIVEAINELQNQIGNLSESRSGINTQPELTTDSKNTIVDAINEVDLHADNNFEVLGAVYTLDQNGAKNSDITNLETTDKSSIVNAINELDARIGETEDLDTTTKESIVDSINEVIDESPFIYNNPDNITNASGVILKNRSDNTADTNTAGNYSLSIGKGNKAGNYSFTTGDGNKNGGNSTGDYSIISGHNNSSQGNYNLVSGNGNTNVGDYNFVNGQNNTLDGYRNTISGQSNPVDINNSVVLGNSNSTLQQDNNNIAIIGSQNSLNATLRQNIEDSAIIGQQNTINGSDAFVLGNDNVVPLKSVIVGHDNSSRNTNLQGKGNVIVGDDNLIACNGSYTLGQNNTTYGDNSYVVGQNNSSGYLDSHNNNAEVKGNNNYILGKNQKVAGNNNIVIGNTSQQFGDSQVPITNSIIIGEFNEPQNNATNIGRDIYIQTHETESKLQSLIFVDLNDWCKNNHSALLNGGLFEDTSHVVQAVKVYKAAAYADQALLRFKMQTNSENGLVIIQGISTRIYLNGSWYYSDNIVEKGWSRHEGEYLKVITKNTVDLQGNPITKHYLALMDQLSTTPVVDTVGGQRSNSEDFGTIDLTKAYGAVDLDDVDSALDLVNRFNQKVDKTAKIITRYADANGNITESKQQNYVDLQNPSNSANITLDLVESFGFDKTDYQLSAAKGQAFGYAPLDGQGKVPASYLPSYVDDVIDVWCTYEKDESTGRIANLHLFEIYYVTDGQGIRQPHQGPEIVEGEPGKIYVEASPKPIGYEGTLAFQFRWTGTQFVSLGSTLTIGTIPGTAFDGGRGVQLEENLEDHLKSGTITQRVVDNNDEYVIDPQTGEYVWEVYKPNPHHVTAAQIVDVMINDPNDSTNENQQSQFIVAHTVESALITLFDRINELEDSHASLASLLGTAQDFEDFDNLNNISDDGIPTVLRTIINNKEEIESFKPITNNTIDSEVDTNFKLFGDI